MIPLINGRAYDFTQILVKILGAPAASASAISYTEEQAKENNYGAGTRPVSRGHGAVTVSASITLSMNDVEAIRDIAPDGSLLKIPSFDVEVSFLNEQRVVTHVLKNCEFTNDGVESSQDDKDVKRSFNLIPSHIKYR
tara:strand:- start:5849 stop:6262 length:414 start_codon:yes stop_codon:yes gene_type:complete